ncbi:MAG TPA: ATP/GTP-binding protein [Streptosporangiaceae bacterium]|nr:ATP/GTP-binding protein [Streptosporangiaceae bacterium]
MLVSPRKARRRPPEAPSKPRRARRPRPAAAGADEADPARLGPPQLQEWPDGDWVVRHVPGAAAAKVYRCPGCDQEIETGTAHVVVWPAQTPGPQARRHWHAACWQRRPPRPPWPR